MRSLALVATLALAAPAHADEVEATAEARPRVSTARRLAAIGAAIVPGLVLRGAGSWVIGERRTARRLLATAALGFGGLVAGGLSVGLTGASPYTTVPGAPLTVVGAGLVLPTWVADIWVAAGGERVRGVPRAAAPWSVELATVWLHDAYRDRQLARVAGRLELGRLGLDGAASADAGGDEHTEELEARWRIRGESATGRAIADGSRLFVRAAARRHRDDGDRVTLVTGEVELAARLDLVHLDPALGGTFGELAVGLGLERAGYPGDAHEYDSLLLGGFAWGAYLGERGEVALFYDHRRDSMAGGLAAWRAAGFVGSFGARLDLRITGPWALGAAFEVGNAYVGTLALAYRGGS